MRTLDRIQSALWDLQSRMTEKKGTREEHAEELRELVSELEEVIAGHTLWTYTKDDPVFRPSVPERPTEPKHFDQKITVLLARSNKVVRNSAKEMLKSGAIELEDHPDTFELPMAFMTVLLEAQAKQHQLFQNKKTEQNLRHFIPS